MLSAKRQSALLTGRDCGGKTRLMTAVLIGLALAGAAHAKIWNVATVPELNNAVGSAVYGDEIVIAPGTYNLTQELWLYDGALTLRGATGNRDDVVLVGSGMNTSGPVNIPIHVHNDNITIRDLTVSECFYHTIQIHGESDIDGTHLYNVRTLNSGQMHVKCSTDAGSDIANDGIIEYCLMDQTKPRYNHPIIDYTGGIDLLGCDNWIIRGNVAKDIYGETGGGGPGIMLWQGIKDCVIEQNIVIGCGKGIALGNPAGPTHPYTPGYHSVGGIVRNNFVLRGTDSDNIALELCYTKDLKVYNNTIYSEDAGYWRTVHLYGASTTNLDSRYNIIRGRIYRNGANWSEIGNITGSTPQASWFVDPGEADFHLTAQATLAIDGAATLAEVTDDVDGHLRPVGDYPDIGADEYGSVPEGGPEIVYTYKYVGGGKYGVTFAIDGSDGQQASYFVNMTFQGTDGGEIQQVQGQIDGEDPEPVDIHDDFNAVVLYHIEAGSGGGSEYEDADLAYIVTTGDVGFVGTISRFAINYPVVGVAVLAPPGDANLDDQVDGADYTIWADNYLASDVGWEGGDFNGDGAADGADYTVWADHYSVGGAGVPEPACVLLLLVGGAMASSRRRAC